MIDVDFSPGQTELAGTARSYFAGFADNVYLNQQQDSELGYEVSRWQQMSDLGWTSVNLPEHLGGGDATLTDAGIVAREYGRAAFASPLLSTMRAGTALSTLNTGGFDDAISRISKGERCTLVAPPDRTIHASRLDGGGYLLTGKPAIVEWLAQADTVALLAPIKGSDHWLCGVLPGPSLSTRVVPVPSIDNERCARLDLDGIRLISEWLATGEFPARDAEYALAKANLLRTSAMVGGCETVLDRSAQYAKERVQFDRPIGSFQAVRHYLARMVIATDAARLVCDEALARAQSDADESAIAAVALFTAGRSYVENVLTAAQVHGGVGTTTEHILHHHFLRAKAMQLRSGKPANRLREIHQALNVRSKGTLW